MSDTPSKDTELYKLLRRGLPDFQSSNGTLKIKKGLAEKLGIHYQAIYGWFDRQSVPAKRVDVLCDLSNETKNRPKGFKPLSREDFWPFIL